MSAISRSPNLANFELCTRSPFWTLMPSPPLPSPPPPPLSLLIFIVQQRPHGPQTYIKDLPLSPLQPASSTATSMHLLALRTRLPITTVTNRLLAKFLQWTSTP